jgi:hypothetical protein
MPAMQTHFFGTRADQLALLRAAESDQQFKYVVSGLFDLSEPEIYENGSDIPTLGIAKNENAINGYCYLVTKREEPISVREIPQRNGTIKHSISQQGNDNTVVFLHGGFFDNVLLYGKIGTVSQTKASKDLYRRFLSAIQAQCERMGSYYVASEAQVFLRNGGRLTQAVQSPREYDVMIL